MISLDATPAEHAQGVLDAIERNPDAFDMGAWFFMPGARDEDNFLPAHAPVDCGTTMCAAGWLAHNAGFDLAVAGGIVVAEKGGCDPEEVAAVGQRLLGLEGWQANDLFVASALTARKVLRRIANGEPWPTTVKSAAKFAYGTSC